MNLELILKHLEQMSCVLGAKADVPQALSLNGDASTLKNFDLARFVDASARIIDGSARIGDAFARGDDAKAYNLKSGGSKSPLFCHPKVAICETFYREARNNSIISRKLFLHVYERRRHPQPIKNWSKKRKICNDKEEKCIQ